MRRRGAAKKGVRPATAITARSDWRSWAASASREKGTRRGAGLRQEGHGIEAVSKARGQGKRRSVSSVGRN
jgi:hypothetical protein